MADIDIEELKKLDARLAREEEILGACLRTVERFLQTGKPEAVEMEIFTRMFDGIKRIDQVREELKPLAARVVADAAKLSEVREALDDNPCRCICDKCSHEHPWETCEVNMSQAQGPNRRDFPEPCGCKRLYGRATDDAPGNCKKCTALAKLKEAT